MSKTPMHTFKMDDKPWQEFLKKATGRQRSGAAILRACIHLYLDEGDANADALDQACVEYETIVEAGRPITDHN
jgi:hypothetical protein